MVILSANCNATIGGVPVGGAPRPWTKGKGKGSTNGQGPTSVPASTSQVLGQLPAAFNGGQLLSQNLGLELLARSMLAGPLVLIRQRASCVTIGTHVPDQAMQLLSPQGFDQRLGGAGGLVNPIVSQVPAQFQQLPQMHAGQSQQFPASPVKAMQHPNQSPATPPGIMGPGTAPGTAAIQLLNPGGPVTPERPGQSDGPAAPREGALVLDPNQVAAWLQQSDLALAAEHNRPGGPQPSDGPTPIEVDGTGHSPQATNDHDQPITDLAAWQQQRQQEISQLQQQQQNQQQQQQPSIRIRNSALDTRAGQLRLWFPDDSFKAASKGNGTTQVEVGDRDTCYGQLRADWGGVFLQEFTSQDLVNACDKQLQTACRLPICALTTEETGCLGASAGCSMVLRIPPALRKRLLEVLARVEYSHMKEEHFALLEKYIVHFCQAAGVHLYPDWQAAMAGMSVSVSPPPNMEAQIEAEVQRRLQAAQVQQRQRETQVQQALVSPPVQQRVQFSDPLATASVVIRHNGKPSHSTASCSSVTDSRDTTPPQDPGKHGDHQAATPYKEDPSALPDTPEEDDPPPKRWKKVTTKSMDGDSWSSIVQSATPLAPPGAASTQATELATQQPPSNSPVPQQSGSLMPTAAPRASHRAQSCDAVVGGRARSSSKNRRQSPYVTRAQTKQAMQSPADVPVAMLAAAATAVADDDDDEL